MFNFNFFKRNVKNEKLLVDSYVKPTIECSTHILLAGPAYGDKTFFGSFLLDVPLSKLWMNEHSKSVFSSSKLDQEARIFFAFMV